jgi:hypothetical protein
VSDPLGVIADRIVTVSNPPVSDDTPESPQPATRTIPAHASTAVDRMEILLVDTGNVLSLHRSRWEGDLRPRCVQVYVPMNFEWPTGEVLRATCAHGLT